MGKDLELLVLIFGNVEEMRRTVLDYVLASRKLEVIVEIAEIDVGVGVSTWWFWMLRDHACLSLLLG
jgi:hypothetical protein